MPDGYVYILDAWKGVYVYRVTTDGLWSYDLTIQTMSGQAYGFYVNNSILVDKKQLLRIAILYEINIQIFVDEKHLNAYILPFIVTYTFQIYLNQQYLFVFNLNILQLITINVIFFHSSYVHDSKPIIFIRFIFIMLVVLNLTKNFSIKFILGDRNCIYKMINQYQEVHNNEEDQAIIQGINPDLFPYYCLLFVTALSTFLGGLLLYDLLENQNYEQDCKVIVVSLQYYSQFLMMDGLAQMYQVIYKRIIWVIMLFVLSYIRNYDIEKGLKRQLFFQLIDTGIFLIILTFIQAGVKEKKHCVSLEGRFTIILYTILIYILFFMLLLAKVD